MQRMTKLAGPIRLIDPALIAASSPARNVVTRSGMRMRGLYSSRRFNRLLPWESSLELHAIELCDFYPGVVDIVSQPIQLALPGLPFRYTPDLVMETSNESVHIIECKPRSRVAGPTAEMLTQIGVALSKAGMTFRVLTEEWVHRPAALTNVRTVMRHRHPKKPLDEERWRRIEKKLPCRFQNAAGATSNLEVLQAIAAWLVVFNLDRPLDHNTWLRAANGEDLDATPFA